MSWRNAEKLIRVKVHHSFSEMICFFTLFYTIMKDAAKKSKPGLAHDHIHNYSKFCSVLSRGSKLNLAHNSINVCHDLWGQLIKNLQCLDVLDNLLRVRCTCDHRRNVLILETPSKRQLRLRDPELLGNRLQMKIDVNLLKNNGPRNGIW